MRIVTCISILLVSINAYNILVYSPAFGNSHMNFMGHLADTLTNAGHNVTLLVPVVDDERKYKTGVKTTKDVVYVEKDERAQRKIPPMDDNMGQYWTEKFDPEQIIDSEKWFSDIMIETCANLLRHSTIFDEMKSRNFDVVMIEPMHVCGMGLAHKLGIKNMILTTSCTHFDFILPHIGEPEYPSFVPSLLSQYGDEMTISERYENFKAAYYMRQSMEKLFDEEEKLYKQHFGEETPSWKELLPAASLYFTNSNPNIDFPRPQIQKTIPIGGISVDMSLIRSQKISEKWDSILALRHKTMLISFGSMVMSKDMPVEWRNNILDVIESLPEVTFIWKYESNDTKWAEHVDNVYFSQWVPQTALLNDKRVTAFLTHGGLGSTNELALCGKPSLMIPIFGDQVRNSRMLSRHGGAIFVNKEQLADFPVIRNAVESILFDENYKNNAERLADILENQPVKPKDLVVKYTEFVAKFGPFQQMDPHSRQLNFIQRNSLDILLFFYYRYYILGIIVLLIFKFTVARFFRTKEKIN